jgi:hypothetical protein
MIKDPVAEQGAVRAVTRGGGGAAAVPGSRLAPVVEAVPKVELGIGGP